MRLINTISLTSLAVSVLLTSSASADIFNISRDVTVKVSSKNPNYAIEHFPVTIVCKSSSQQPTTATREFRIFGTQTIADEFRPSSQTLSMLCQGTVQSYKVKAKKMLTKGQTNETITYSQQGGNPALENYKPVIVIDAANETWYLENSNYDNNHPKMR